MRQGQSARRLWIIVVVFSSMSEAAPAGVSTTDMETLKVGDVVFEFVRIPTGRFLMGSSSDGRDERPAHEVTIADELYIGRTEVTVRQFRAFARATGYRTDAEQLGWAHTCPLPGMHPHQRGLDWRQPGFEQSDNHPAVVLSRSDAAAFCRWLREQTGRTCRLPTEAEWEYAARAGRPDESAGNLKDVAWYEDNTSNGPHAVATKMANPWGLYDMQGNASEWCLDVWRPDYHGAAIDGRARVVDPTIPPAVIWRHVLRGGGWASPKDQLRYGQRDRCLASFASPATGFRIALCAPSRSSVISSEAQDCAARPPERGHGALSTDSTGRTTLATHGVQFEFVRVPAGEFLMGTEEGSIEKPVHRVRIGYDFEMGRTEVTVAQFRAFVEATGYMTDGEKAGVGSARRGGQDWQAEPDVNWRDTTFPQSDEHPATFISWYDAMAFCHWLSVETGQEIHLPSESEWEYACRAGTTGAYAGQVSAMGWYQYNSSGRTHPVAQRQPNAWGLYDMAGNVWEWCLDFFTTSYEGAPTDGSPRWDLYPTTDVVSRGGSFANPPGWLGSAIRMGSFPDCSHYNNGFRLVHVLKDTDKTKETTGLVPLKIELPMPVFISWPSYERAKSVDPPRREPWPPLLVPPETTNVALGKSVSSADDPPLMGHLSMVTDGNKGTSDDDFLELDAGVQYVMIDLGARHAIDAICLWHYVRQYRAYYDVIVQVADDPEMMQNVTTLFNNDMDNSAGLGPGRDRHYVETHFGKLIDAKGVHGRYVRLYSNGNTTHDLNSYVEVEVYGRP